jgi:hypothetical protein
LTDTFTFSQDIVMWLSGYYNGKRNNTIIQPDAVKKNAEKVNLYCYDTAKRRSWMPPRTRSALTNKFTQHSHWSWTTKQAGCSLTDHGGGKRRWLTGSKVADYISHL